MVNEDTSRNIRRDTKRGPSPLRHGIIAFILAFTVLMGAYLGLRHLVKKTSSAPPPKVTITATNIEAEPILSADETPDIPEEQLPDLLGANIPADTNPTDILAKSETPDLTPDQKTEDKPTPRIIRINGQPAGRDTATPLIKAPIQGLSRQSPYGSIPTIAENGDSAFTRYAKPFRTPVNAKSVAIIIGGLGLNAEITTRAILDLPEEITLSFAAHSPQLQSWIDQARENGHEVLLEIPMQANGTPPNQVTRTLVITDDIALNTRNLDWLMSRASGYFAVTNYNGDQFLSRSDVVAPMMDYLTEAGLGLVFDSSFDAVALPALATSAKLPFIESQLVLDEVNSQPLTQSKLEELGEKAISGQNPIGIGFAYRGTIESVSKWAKTAPETGLVLVPVSHLMAP